MEQKPKTLLKLSTPTDTEARCLGQKEKTRVFFVEEPVQENSDKCLKRIRQHEKLWFLSLFPMCGL